MDEILSSIRQIIADDDAAAAAPRPARASSAPAAVQPVPDPDSDPEAAAEPAGDGPAAPDDGEGRALELRPDQIVGKEGETRTEDSDAVADPSQPAGAQEPMVLVEPDDVTFASDDDSEGAAPPSEAAAPEPPPVATSPRHADPRPTSPQPVAPSVARSAPMPDPTLSRDMAEQLLEPATKAAVRMSMARLGNLAVGAPGLTIEEMTRELLRPMLKEWLDEHLPSVVERMVEKEIARVSRGED